MIEESSSALSTLRSSPAPADHDVQSLVREGATDNAETFEDLYDAYVTLVYGIIRRILGQNNGDIEDVVQTTFLRFWRLAPTSRAVNVGGTFARIARNAAIEALRKRTRSLSANTIDPGAFLFRRLQRVVSAGGRRCSRSPLPCDAIRRRTRRSRTWFFRRLDLRRNSKQTAPSIRNGQDSNSIGLARTSNEPRVPNLAAAGSSTTT